VEAAGVQQDQKKVRDRCGDRVDEQGEALHAAGKADAGDIRAAERRDQAVVAAAAGHRGLGADVAGDDLEGGAHVVIQAPHQTRIEHVLAAGRVEQALYRVEMRGAFRAQVVGDARGVGRELLALGDLAVEHPQRVGELAAHAVLAQLFLVHALQELPQDVEEHGPAFGAAQGVELHRELGEPQGREVLAQHEENFGVESGLGGAHRLHVDLVELAHAALLRPFIAEHGAVGENFGQPVVGAFVLDERPHDPGRGFGPQRQGTPLAIREGVHFLLDHVGLLPDGTGEEFRAFKHRNAQFPVAIAGENRPGGAFDKREHTGFRRKDVGEPFDFLYFVHEPATGVRVFWHDVEKEERT